MKRILTLTTALLFMASCKVTTLPTEKEIEGCWYEGQVRRHVCGVAEKYNANDSTYIMRTYDGWAMRVAMDKICWK